VWFAAMRRPLRLLPPALLASGITVPLAVVLIVQHGSTLVYEGAVVVIVLCALPAMLALGAGVCLLLMKASGPGIQRMYGIDLLGACLGAVAIIPLLHRVPTPELAAACGFLPLFAALQYGRVWCASAAVLAAILSLVMATTPWLHVTRSKSFDEALVPPVFERWTPTARLTVFDETLLPGPWTDSRLRVGPRQQDTGRPAQVRRNGSNWTPAPAPITAFDGVPAKSTSTSTSRRSVTSSPAAARAIIGAGRTS
jgi:hypothetical protein